MHLPMELMANAGYIAYLTLVNNVSGQCRLINSRVRARVVVRARARGEARVVVRAVAVVVMVARAVAVAVVFAVSNSTINIAAPQI